MLELIAGKMSFLFSFLFFVSSDIAFDRERTNVYPFDTMLWKITLQRYNIIFKYNNNIGGKIAFWNIRVRHVLDHTRTFSWNWNSFDDFSKKRWVLQMIEQSLFG